MNLGTLLSLRWLRFDLSHTVYRQNSLEQHRQRYPNAHVARGCQIGKDVVLADGVSIREGVSLNGSVHIGRASFFNGPAEIRSGPSKIEIGSFCSFAAGLTLICANHPMGTPSTYKTNLGRYGEIFSGAPLEAEPIRIGSDVWAGNNSTVLKGVTIGHGAIIAAGAVVVSDVEPYSIVGGIPAKPIRYRFPEHVRDWLLALQWWEWPEHKMEVNKQFFQTELTGLSIDELEQLVIEADDRR